MDQKYFKSGNNYFLREVSNVEDPLQVALYVLQFSPKEGFYLEKSAEDFHVNHKIYGKDEKAFTERVKKTFNATKDNLGVLLNGVKGTGKSVQLKLIANHLELPIIIIPQAYEGVADYISKIPYSVTLVFDEFEKMYPANYNNNADILTVMEGVLANQYRRVFLLTTNSTYINDNLLERPGRIRYHRTYEDLPLETIEEIVDDLLEYKDLRTATIDFLSTLKTITIDIVKKIVEEVNIHNEDPKIFGKYFNIKKDSKKYDVLIINENGTEKVWFEDVALPVFDPKKPIKDLRVNGEWEAKIISILSPTMLIVDEQLNENNEPEVHIKIKIVDRDNLHKSFRVF